MVTFSHEAVSVQALDALLAAKAADGWDLVVCFPMATYMEAGNEDARLFCIFKKTL